MAWQRQLKVVASSVQGLKETKLARDQRILLALLTNAARSTPQQKVLFKCFVFATNIPLFAGSIETSVLVDMSHCSVYRRVAHC